MTQYMLKKPLTTADLMMALALLPEDTKVETICSGPVTSLVVTHQYAEFTGWQSPGVIHRRRTGTRVLLIGDPDA